MPQRPNLNPHLFVRTNLSHPPTPNPFPFSIYIDPLTYQFRPTFGYPHPHTFAPAHILKSQSPLTLSLNQNKPYLQLTLLLTHFFHREPPKPRKCLFTHPQSTGFELIGRGLNWIFVVDPQTNCTNFSFYSDDHKLSIRSRSASYV